MNISSKTPNYPEQRYHKFESINACYQLRNRCAYMQDVLQNKMGFYWHFALTLKTKSNWSRIWPVLPQFSSKTLKCFLEVEALKEGIHFSESNSIKKVCCKKLTIKGKKERFVRSFTTPKNQKV